MPSLKAVRIRIASVKSTQKITRAMKLVAAARLKRAQDSIMAARPYARSLAEAVAEVAARAGEEAHPLLEQRPIRRVAVITMTSDRGLCGGFNTNVCKATQRFVDERKAGGNLDEFRIEVVGRKGREYFKRRKLAVSREYTGVTSDEAIARSKEVALTATELFRNGTVDAVYIAYNEFKSAISQRPLVEQLLPVRSSASGEETATDGHPKGVEGVDFLYEPSKPELLELMLPLYLENQVYRAMLESIASEFGARMSAMDNATKNAADMIERLTLQYNRARQAAITKELMEIVGGAEALKG